MPVKNFSITATTDLITPSSEKIIRIIGFWFELSHDWINGDIFAFREKEKTENYFPKSTSGLAAMNLVNIGQEAQLPKGKTLEGYLSSSGKRVQGTILYELL